MTLFRFACVGATGFVIDCLSFVLLSTLAPPVTARGASFWIAASSNWYLNRHFTFRQSGQHQAAKQWGQFLCASVVGFLPNWGIYVWLLHNTPWAQDYTLAAMVPGILAGMLVNYLLAKSWVFKAVQDSSRY